MPNHYGGDLLHTMGISGLSRVRTELFELFVVPALAPHPVQMHRQFPGHRDLRDLSSASHGQMEELTAPLRLTSYRDLGRFHQQKAKQYVALLADVPKSSPVAAGLFRRNQSYIAGDLLATCKTFRQCRSLTRRLVPSVDPRQDASSAAASRNVSPPRLPALASTHKSLVSVGRISRAGLAVVDWPKAQAPTTPAALVPPAATTPSSDAHLR